MNRQSLQYWGRVLGRMWFMEIGIVVIMEVYYAFFLDGIRLDILQALIVCGGFIILLTTGTDRKGYRFQLAISFSSTRKKELAGYILSELAFILIVGGVILGMEVITHKWGIIMMEALLLYGAGAGQMFAQSGIEVEKKIQYTWIGIAGVLVGITGVIMIFIPDMPHIMQTPFMVVAVLYYVAACRITVRSIGSIEVRM